MKHTRTRILSILAATALSLCSLPKNAPITLQRPAITASAVESGTCGENLTWTLNEGKLIISGKGAMTDYNNSDSPFAGHNDIQRVFIEEGVTSIGSNAFHKKRYHMG